MLSEIALLRYLSDSSQNICVDTKAAIKWQSNHFETDICHENFIPVFNLCDVSNREVPGMWTGKK